MSKFPKEAQIIPWARDVTETKERKRRTRIKQGPVVFISGGGE